MPVPWLSDFVRLAHERLLALPPGHEAWHYLASRGVTPEQVREYRVGWVYGAHEAVPPQPIPEEFWKWLLRFGWSRLLFPLTDPWGDPMGLQLRSIAEKGFANWVDPVQKQLVPTCFGLHVALPAMFASQRVLLVEGIFDYFALRPHTAEVLGAMSALASTVLRRTLTRYCTSVVALFDMDRVGRRGCHKLAGLPIPPALQDPNDPVVQHPKLPPYRVSFPAYTEHDPSDLLKVGKVDELRRLSRYG